MEYKLNSINDIEGVQDKIILSKKKTNKFEHIGFICLFLFNKDIRKAWKEKKKEKNLIKELIQNRDFSTLFELSNKGYVFSEKQQQDTQKSLNKMFLEANEHLMDKGYENKLLFMKTMKNYNVPMTNENYYHFIVSNSFELLLSRMEKGQLSENELRSCQTILEKLKNPEFKEGLQEFIICDIEHKPKILNPEWDARRQSYYAPRKNTYLFEGMTKTQLKRIVNAIDAVTPHASFLNEFKSLLNQAPIDKTIMKEFNLNTTSVVAKAQKSMFLNEDGLTKEMKEKINEISSEITKIQKNDAQKYEEEIEKISNELLPNVVRKYLSIDEEYRHTLRNVEGKLPSELLLESLENIYLQVNYINQQINQEKVSQLSINNRVLKISK